MPRFDCVLPGHMHSLRNVRKSGHKREGEDGRGEGREGGREGSFKSVSFRIVKNQNHQHSFNFFYVSPKHRAKTAMNGIGP